jgi:hypothetical protein
MEKLAAVTKRTWSRIEVANPGLATPEASNDVARDLLILAPNVAENRHQVQKLT